jgi:nitrogen-specific signal transduction histidine kinase
MLAKQRSQHNARNTMENSTAKIPEETAKELRTLAHDLSNALETIVQATYLISQAGPPESSRRWIEMIDQASQDAVRINHKLRQVLRSQS